MVRRGSTVRVRQRAPEKDLLMRVFLFLISKRTFTRGYQTGTRVRTTEVIVLAFDEDGVRGR